MLPSVLAKYGLWENDVTATPFGSGLIHRTWKVITTGQSYILQQVNTQVFQHPENISYNIESLAEYLHIHHPQYLFVAPIKALNGLPLVSMPEGEVFRLFPFVEGSCSKDIVSNAEEAFEAAAQFGQFTAILNDFDATRLKTTIPDFHNLSLRYKQFLNALKNGNSTRIKEALALTKTLQSFADVTVQYDRILKNNSFKIRVTHHDTKISNVLFNKDNKGICVVDLDTVMPGYFISDVGDMMRTYLSSVGEEEADFTKIDIRENIYKAIVEGYCSKMHNKLTDTEKEHFFYAGVFGIFMQAIRFLTDFLNNDVYYGTRYPNHNLIRAGNQATLLQRLVQKEGILCKVNGL